MSLCNGTIRFPSIQRLVVVVIVIDVRLPAIHHLPLIRTPSQSPPSRWPVRYPNDSPAIQVHSPFCLGKLNDNHVTIRIQHLRFNVKGETLTISKQLMYVDGLAGLFNIL